MDLSDRLKKAAEEAQTKISELSQDVKQRYEDSDLDERFDQLKQTAAQQFNTIGEEVKRTVEKGVDFAKETHQEATKKNQQQNPDN